MTFLARIRASEIAAFLLVVLLLFAGIRQLDLWNPDEPAEAQIAREMYLRGDVVIPTLNRETYLDKPPLYFALAATLYKLTGRPNELAARLPSLAAACLTAFLVLLMSRAVAPHPAPLLSLLVLSTCYLFFYLGRRAQTDMTVAFLITLSLFFFFQYLRKPSNALLFGAAALLGPAYLAKGVFGLVIPLWIMGLYLLRNRDFRVLRSFGFWAGLFLALSVIACWGYLVFQRLGFEGLHNAFVENSIGRLRGEYAGHLRPPYYYLIQAPVAVLPWVFLWIPLISEGWKVLKKGGGTTPLLQQKQLLFIWVAGGILLLSFSESKRTNYLLPFIIPFALLSGCYLQEAWEKVKASTQAQLWGWRAQGLLLALLVAFVGSVCWARLPFAAAIALLVISVLLLALVLVSLRLECKRQIPVYAMAGLFVYFSAALFILPAANELKSARKLSLRMVTLDDGGTAFLGYKTYWGLISQYLFYTRRFFAVANDPTELALLMRRHPDALMLLTEEDLHRIPLPLRRQWRVAFRDKVGSKEMVVLRSKKG